jgi:hypothetical protein
MNSYLFLPLPYLDPLPLKNPPSLPLNRPKNQRKKGGYGAEFFSFFFNQIQNIFIVSMVISLPRKV